MIYDKDDKNKKSPYSDELLINPLFLFKFNYIDESFRGLIKYEIDFKITSNENLQLYILFKYFFNIVFFWIFQHIINVGNNIKPDNLHIGIRFLYFL